MSRSIRCSDQAYQRVTAVAGEKGLSLLEALDDIIIAKQAQVEKESPPRTAPTNTGPFFQTREEVKDTIRDTFREVLKSGE